MAKVLYAYDKIDGRTIILEHNNTIYLGGDMDDSLANPIQSEEIGIRIDFIFKTKEVSQSSDRSSNNKPCQWGSFTNSI